MYKPVTMDARRVDALSSQVSGLRFFQQLPHHLVHKFISSMVLHKLAAESLVFKEGDLGDSFCVVLQGAIAVYAKRRRPNVPQKEAEPIPPETLDGDIDHSAPPTPRTEASPTTATTPSALPNTRRPMKNAVAGSISIPSHAKYNPHTGSISVPSDFDPLKKEKPEARPEDREFSLVVSGHRVMDSISLENAANERRGISLVPGWVSPPTSDDDDDDNSHSDSDSDKASTISEGDEELDETTEQIEARKAAAAKAVEKAREEVRKKREEEEARKEAAELEALAKEEAELRRLEAEDAKAELECITTLQAGDSFGLLTVLERAKRAATLICLDDTELACMSRATYQALMKELNQDPRFPERPRCDIPSQAKYLRLLRAPSEQRSDPHLNYLLQPLVTNNRMLQLMDNRALQLFASGMKILTIPKSGVILQKQGEEAQWVYVVVRGSVSEHYKLHTAADHLPGSPLKADIHAGSTDVTNLYGPCARLLLIGDVSPFPDADVQSPSFWSHANCTLLTREPTILAKVSVDYLSHVLSGLAKPMKNTSAVRDALRAEVGRRTEAQLEALDSVLKNVTLFQFKPPALRKALCAKMKYTAYPRNAHTVIFQEGQASDDHFYIILSGTVSIHQRPLIEGDTSPPKESWNPTADRVLPDFGPTGDILKLFGPCLALGRAGTHFGDQALTSSLPRNMTIITRGPVELMAVSKADYTSVFIPVLDEMQYHASKALQLLSRPVRNNAVVNQLLDVLKHVPYFADMSNSMRAFAIRHCEIETVEGDSVIFLEDDLADFLYVIMSGSVGVYIQDRKLKAAKLESLSSEQQEEQAKRQAERETAMQNRSAEIHQQIADANAAEAEIVVKTEAELLAEQMERDALKEAARILAESKDVKLKAKEARQARRLAAGQYSSDSEEDKDDDDDDSDNSEDEDSDEVDEDGGKQRRGSHILNQPGLTAAAATRMQASARGDVFTASGAGQYALARRLRGNSISIAAGSPDVVASLKKQESDAFKQRMASAANRGLARSPTPSGSDDDAAGGASGGDAASIERQLNAVLSSGVETGRTQVGHLNAAERTEQFGNCVVQLPSGSVVGEAALTTAGQKARRNATIITMEPTFFIKLHADVVSRLTFGRNNGGGSHLSQDAAASFLKGLDILRIVKGSATGHGTGSHATFKRLAYHMKDRKLVSGVKMVEQGTKSDSVFFIVSGTVLMSRSVLLNGIRRNKHGQLVHKGRFITHPQEEGEPFQRIDTSYLPAPTTPEQPQPTPSTTVDAANPASALAGRPTSATTTGPVSNVQVGLPSPPEGIHSTVELTVAGAGELVGGLEVTRNEPFSSTFVVTSAECVVLQMEKKYFLSLFPQRAVEQVKTVGEQRAKLYQGRVEKHITMKCSHVTTNPAVIALSHMQGSSGPVIGFTALQSTPYVEEEAPEQVDTNHAAIPTLPTATPGLSGSVSKLSGRPTSAVPATALGHSASTPMLRPMSAMHLGNPHLHAKKAMKALGKDVRTATEELQELDDPTLQAALTYRPSTTAVVTTSSPSKAALTARPKDTPLQSDHVLLSMNLTPIRGGDHLTPVQRVLGYTEDPTMEHISWTERERAAGRLRYDEVMKQDQRPSTAAAQVGRALRRSSQTQSAAVLSTSSAAARPSSAAPGRQSLTQSLALSRSASSSTLPPSHPPLSASNSNSSRLGSELAPPSSQSEHEVDSVAKEQRMMRRGSFKVDAAFSKALGAAEYNTLVPPVVPNQDQIEAFSTVLSRQSVGGIIGIDKIPHATDKEAIENEHARMTGEISRARSRLASPLGSQNVTPSVSTNGTPRGDRSSLASPMSPITPNQRRGSTTMSVESESKEGTSQAASGHERAPSVTSMDIESRAVVLMRAERAQIAWETSEVNRRGHKLMDKLRPTSYNISQEEKQMKLSKSLAWDHVDKTDPSSQSNAFLHAASPPLAVMNKFDLLTNKSDSDGTTTVPSDNSSNNALTKRTARSSADLLPQPQQRASSATRQRKAANLTSSTSPLVRSLLTPLVDSGFTSLFATNLSLGAGIDSSGFFTAAKAISPQRKKSTSRPSSGFPTAATRRSPSKPNLLGGAADASSRPMTTQTGRMEASGSGQGTPLRPATAATRSAEGYRFTPATSRLDPTTYNMHGIGIGVGIHNVESAPISPKIARVAHRVPSAAMQRPSTAASSSVSGANSARVPTSEAILTSPVKQVVPILSESYEHKTSDRPDSPILDDHAVTSMMDQLSPNLFVDPHASHSNSTLVSPQQRISAFSKSTGHTPHSGPLSPIRHTRTSSFGTFMQLSSAGVDRLTTPLAADSLNSPSHSDSSVGVGYFNNPMSPSSVAEEDESTETITNNPSLEVHINMIEETPSAMVSPASQLDRNLRSKSLASSPTAAMTAFLPAPHYSAGNITAIQKQSFHDDKREHALVGAKVVLDSHQSMYSRRTPQPNPKNLHDTISKDEAEVLRRKKLFSIQAPKITPDTPSAFSQVLAQSEAMPDALLASRTAVSHKKAKRDEKVVAKATRHGGLAATILHEFKQASERAPNF